MRFCLILLLVWGCGDDAAPTDASMDAFDASADARDASDDAGSDAFDAFMEPDAGVALPPQLSATGLYADGTTLADGVIEYAVVYPLWSDGLEKRRFISVPTGTMIDTSNPDEWVFPPGTKLWKEFSLDGVRLETRLFLKAGPDAWGYVSYVWRADGSDADAAPEGVVDVAGTFHDVPSTEQCFNCHRGASDLVLGVSAFQLARTDRTALVSAGILPADAPSAEPPGRRFEADALGAMHANCGHCHSGVHPLAPSRALRLKLRVGDDALETTGFYTTTIGATAAHVIGGTDQIVVAGDPEASQLFVRAGLRDDGTEQMPPIGTEMVDADLVDLLDRLIRSL